MGAKFIDVELGNNFLMAIGVLVNRDRSASNHHSMRWYEFVIEVAI